MNGDRDEMACRVCLAPLNTLDGRYLHPIHHDNDGHQPVPVPVSTLETVRRSCDFWGDDRPMWTLAGGAVSVVAVGLDVMNDYGQTWAACVACEADIADGRPGKVVDRALQHMGISGHPDARERIGELHQAFLAERRLGRVLITTTAWPTTTLHARDLPKVRDRLAAFYRSRDDLPDNLGINYRRRDLADSLDRSRLYWIDADFTDLAEHAATQLPAVSLGGDLLPCGDGILVWARPVTASGVAAASWTRHGDSCQIATYRSIGAGLDGPPMQRLRDDVGWLAPMNASRIHQEQMYERGHHAAALFATWLLIAQKAAEAIPADVDKAVRKTYARKHRPLPDIRIVRIHAPSTTTVAPPESPSTSDVGGRKYTSRFWVSGHWRNQAYGPSRALRRPVYIHPFLRGPEDKPIKLSTTVRMLSSKSVKPDDHNQ